jgi:caffeoyl-CoA O-methyltransferase
MNKTLITLTLALGGSAINLLAQGPDSPPRDADRKDPRFPAPPIMQALDANRDGVIDADEIANASAGLKKLDKTGDGKLTTEEYGFKPGSPDGGPPAGGPGATPGRAQPRTAAGGPISFKGATVPKNEIEKKILAVLADMNQTQRGGSMSVPEQDGRILRLLTETLGAKQVVEIGTSIGYSGIWFCLGLQQTGGKLTTFEIDAARAATARANFKRAAVDDRVTLVEGDAHELVSRLEAPIDLLFLDADKEGYVDYLKKLLPKVRPGGLIVAHNMNQRQADPRYVAAITDNPELETVFLNMESGGIGVSMKKR